MKQKLIKSKISIEAKQRTYLLDTTPFAHISSPSVRFINRNKKYRKNNDYNIEMLIRIQ